MTRVALTFVVPFAAGYWLPKVLPLVPAVVAIVGVCLIAVSWAMGHDERARQ